ncbi:MAG: pilus assembly FimT family protein [Phycisphaerales bacterium]
MRDQLTSRRGLSLTEVLVTIAATAILTGLQLFGIRAVCGQTLAMKDLHNLRLSGQDMHLWSAENDDKFLNIESPDSTLWQQGLEEVLGPQSFWASYYSQPLTWNSILGHSTDTQHEHWQSVYGLPQYPPELESSAEAVERLRQSGNAAWTRSPSRYRYTLTLLTDISLWEPSVRAGSPDDLDDYARPVRRSVTRSPSAKGMLVNHSIPGLPNMFHAVFVDGSAAASTPHFDNVQVHHPFTSNGSGGLPVLHTLHGYQGVDR